MHDLASEVKVSKALTTAAITSDTNTDGDIIDRAGFDSLMFVIQSGTLTDGTYTPVIQEGDASNLSDASATAAGDLVGTIAAATFALTADNVVKKIGYKGNKRYVRLRITSTATTTGGTLGATAIQGHPGKGPVS